MSEDDQRDRSKGKPSPAGSPSSRSPNLSAPIPRPPPPRPLTTDLPAIPRPPARPASLVRPPSAPALQVYETPMGLATGPKSTSKSPPQKLVRGQLLAGRYRLTKQIGRGGMGTVFEATQEPLARSVAVKVLRGSADASTIARFEREARLIARLQHPHVVGLIDFGEDAGRLFLVMELIDGEPLSALLARQPQALDPQRIVDIALQVSEALAAAHDIQVVHRDVKPDNIMVQRTAAGGDFVTVLDFGVAKIMHDESGDGFETKAGVIVGSPRYISPEQVASRPITPRTDVYSLGCVLYEMLTRRRVFMHESATDCAIAHIKEAPEPPTLEGVELTGPLVDFIMRCLEKDPQQRPADAREAIGLLAECRDDPVSNHPYAGRPKASLRRVTRTRGVAFEGRAAPNEADEAEFDSDGAAPPRRRTEPSANPSATSTHWQAKALPELAASPSAGVVGKSVAAARGAPKRPATQLWLFTAIAITSLALVAMLVALALR